MKQIKCKRCGYEWITRIDKPKACPRCKRYDYDKDIDNDNTEK